MSYVQGFVIPVPTGKRDAYLALATEVGAIFTEYGASRIVECWGADVPDGKSTDFKMAVKAELGETVVFAWIEWPSREACDAAAARMREDERMKPGPDMPFDPSRMIYGGFEPILDTGRPR